MFEYGIFCLATAIVTIVRIQIPAARLVRRQESLVFWIILFITNSLFAPLMFLGAIFFPERFKMTTAAEFLDRHSK